MNDRDIPGMGDYSPPEEPDEERASEDALIATMGVFADLCVGDIRQLAEEEHATFYRAIGKDPDLCILGDYEGLWYDIYTRARDACVEGERLEELRKQGEQQNA